MMSRDIQTKLPSIIAAPTTAVHQLAQQKDAKAKQKKYANKHRQATDGEYKIGDTIMLH